MAADVVADAIERELAALDAFEAIHNKKPAAGKEEMCAALLAVVQDAKPPPTTPAGGGLPEVAPTTLRHIVTSQYVHDFIDNKKQWKGAVASFEGFVGLYNQLVDQAMGLPPSSRALAMAKTQRSNRKARQNSSDPLELQKQSRAEGPNAVTSSGDAPDMEMSRSRSVRRNSFTVANGAANEPSPDVLRSAGVRKYDYSSPGVREESFNDLKSRRTDKDRESSPWMSEASPGTSMHGSSRGPSTRARRNSLPSNVRVTEAISLDDEDEADSVTKLPLTNDATPKQKAAAAKKKKFRDRRLTQDIASSVASADSASETATPPTADRRSMPAPLTTGLSREAPSAGQGTATPRQPRQRRSMSLAEMVDVRKFQPEEESQAKINHEAARRAAALGPDGAPGPSPRRSTGYDAADMQALAEASDVGLSGPSADAAAAASLVPEAAEDEGDEGKADTGRTSGDDEGAEPEAPSAPPPAVESEAGMGLDARLDAAGVSPPGAERVRRNPSSQQKTAESLRGSKKSPLLTRRGTVLISREMGEEKIEEILSLPEDIVGTYSCHGSEPADDCNVPGGIAKINQDCACAGAPFAGLDNTALFTVFDGHGRFGDQVSQEAMHTIYSMLEIAEKELTEDPGGTLADAFEATNVHLRLMACEETVEVNALDSGACAVVAFLNGRELFVAGVGDCRCVLATRPAGNAPDNLLALPLSLDHKVDLPAEKARVEAQGAYVRPGKEASDGEFVPARLYENMEQPHLGPGLCVARALGDLNALRAGLIPTPDIFTHVVAAEDQFLILASDGVWEFIDNAEAIDIVAEFYNKGLPANDAARFLIAKSAIRWRDEEGDYRDDITAVVVYLQELLQKFESNSESIKKRRASDLAPPSS